MSSTTGTDRAKPTSRTLLLFAAGSLARDGDAAVDRRIDPRSWVGEGACS
jgi:hypothetical protein